MARTVPPLPWRYQWLQPRRSGGWCRVKESLNGIEPLLLWYKSLEPRLHRRQWLEPRLHRRQWLEPRLHRRQSLEPRFHRRQWLGPRLHRRQWLEPRLHRRRWLEPRLHWRQWLEPHLHRRHRPEPRLHRRHWPEPRLHRRQWREPRLHRRQFLERRLQRRQWLEPCLLASFEVNSQCLFTPLRSKSAASLYFVSSAGSRTLLAQCPKPLLPLSLIALASPLSKAMTDSMDCTKVIMTMPWRMVTYLFVDSHRLQ